MLILCVSKQPRSLSRRTAEKLYVRRRIVGLKVTSDVLHFVPVRQRTVRQKQCALFAYIFSGN